MQVLPTVLIFFLVIAVACSTDETTSQLRDDDTSNTVATTDYLYDSPIRVTRSHSSRILGPTPVLFRDHLDQRASIDFPWNNAHGLMVRAAGDLVTIAYERGPSDDGQSGEIENITVFYRFPGSDTVHSSAMQGRAAGPHPESFRADVTTNANMIGVLEFWFEIKTTTGAQYWDSQFGDNYGVYLVANRCTRLSFDNVRDGHWPTPRVEGTLKSGGALCLNYDEGRAYALGLTDTFYRGGTIKPSMRGWAEFFDADGRSLNKAEFSNVKATGMPIPSGTSRVALWFKGSTYSGRTAWDSRDGKNYNFTVQP